MRQLSAVKLLVAGTLMPSVFLFAMNAFGADDKMLFSLGRSMSTTQIDNGTFGNQQSTLHGLSPYTPVLFVYNGIADPAPTSNVLFVKASQGACSGVLKHGNCVLTAAHCACKSIIGVYAVGPKSKMTLLQLASEAIPMCGCKKDTYPPSLPDVAIMKLKNTDGLAPAAKIASSSAIDGALTGLFVFGYGESDIGARSMSTVGTRRYGGALTVATSRRDKNVGTKTDHEYYGCNKGTDIVAFSSRYDQCEGDSGGPLFDGQKANSKVLALAVRQVSDHDGETAICGSGGIYVRLDGEVGEWIQKTMDGQLINPPKICQADQH
ncbi:secreted trypsin-like serine protease [Paraburkholderia sp. GAS199]|uniref:trypsin-like serine protease n=1 Tax=Paraburkholderia sp. GAS199 TaxID=3035126 RepID=UPI003D1F879C